MQTPEQPKGSSLAGIQEPGLLHRCRAWSHRQCPFRTLPGLGDRAAHPGEATVLTGCGFFLCFCCLGLWGFLKLYSLL